MPARIDLEFTDSGARRLLTHLRDRLADPGPAWEEYATWLRGEFAKQFDSEGDYLGRNPWAPLSPAYAKRKARRYPGAKILQATKRMMRSLTEPGGDNRVRYTDDHFEFGSDVPYLRFHQTGTSKMPARPPVADENELAAGLGRIWMRHLFSEGANLLGDTTESSEGAEL